MTVLWRETGALLRKEVVLEWRSRTALSGLVLYLVSTVAVGYLGLGGRAGVANPAVWNVLFWIILLFTATSTAGKSFANERGGRQLYLYTLASPEALILAKIGYNVLLVGGLSLIGYGVYSLLLGNPVADQGLFVLNLLLGAVGFAATLTLVAGIAAKADNNAVLMAVLSFPVILPMLLLLIRVSRQALDGLDRSVSQDEIVSLLALNLIVGGLSYLLFPYLWRS